MSLCQQWFEETLSRETLEDWVETLDVEDDYERLNLRDELDDKHERNREQRLKAIQRWVQYIIEHRPDDWGTQQNRLIDSQLASAREAGLDVQHYHRVEQAGDEQTDR